MLELAQAWALSGCACETHKFQWMLPWKYTWKQQNATASGTTIAHWRVYFAMLWSQHLLYMMHHYDMHLAMLCSRIICTLLREVILLSNTQFHFVLWDCSCTTHSENINENACILFSTYGYLTITTLRIYAALAQHTKTVCNYQTQTLLNCYRTNVNKHHLYDCLLPSKLLSRAMLSVIALINLLQEASNNGK